MVAVEVQVLIPLELLLEFTEANSVSEFGPVDMVEMPLLLHLFDVVVDVLVKLKDQTHHDVLLQV